MTVFVRHIRALQRYAEASGIEITRAPLPACVLGRTCHNRITLRDDLAPEQELPTLIHELAHSIVHRPIVSSTDCTLYEYEAEAVEAVVMARLGTLEHHGARDALYGPLETPTDGLLAVSVSRVRVASERIFEALDAEGEVLDAQGAEAILESQPAVDLEAAAGKEVVLENEAYRLSNLLGLAQPL